MSHRPGSSPQRALSSRPPCLRACTKLNLTNFTKIKAEFYNSNKGCYNIQELRGAAVSLLHVKILPGEAGGVDMHKAMSKGQKG